MNADLGGFLYSVFFKVTDLKISYRLSKDTSK